MIDYHLNFTIKIPNQAWLEPFKNSRKFCQFYQSWVKVRSDKSSFDGPTQITVDPETVSDPVEIVDHFNSYFTSIESVSLSNVDDSVKFIENHFNNLKSNKTIVTDSDGFHFSRVSDYEVKSVISNLSSSSGSSGNSKIYSWYSYSCTR